MVRDRSESRSQALALCIMSLQSDLSTSRASAKRSAFIDSLSNFAFPKSGTINLFASFSFSPWRLLLSTRTHSLIIRARNPTSSSSDGSRCEKLQLVAAARAKAVPSSRSTSRPAALFTSKLRFTKLVIAAPHMMSTVSNSKSTPHIVSAKSKMVARVAHSKICRVRCAKGLYAPVTCKGHRENGEWRARLRKQVVKTLKAFNFSLNASDLQLSGLHVSIKYYVCKSKAGNRGGTQFPSDHWNAGRSTSQRFLLHIVAFWTPD